MEHRDTPTSNNKVSEIIGLREDELYLDSVTVHHHLPHRPEAVDGHAPPQ